MIGIVIKSVSALFLDLVETLVIGISIFLVIYLFFMQPHQVSGQSMESTLMNKDYVLTDKISYRTGEPQRGDIVVVHAPEAANCPTGTGCDFIKRMIGLPGDTVEIKDSSVYVNGSKLSEPYVDSGNQTLPGNFTRDRSITLGPDQYFVVGDNRMHSSDSRAWGPVSKDDIVGRAFFRYWPMQSIQVLEHATY
jgi:signal peptidase I